MIGYVAAAAVTLALAAWFAWESRRRRTHPVTGGLHPDITLPFQQEFELYGNPFSHCSRKTRIVFAELGIAYQHHNIDLIETGSYQTISPAYLKINPAGLVPCLLHHGHPVYESDEILRYAAAQTGPQAARLVPDDPAARASMQRWIDYASLSSANPMGARATSAGGCVPGLTMPIFMTAIAYIPLRRILVGFLFHPDKKRPLFFCTARILGIRRMLKIAPLREMITDSREHMSRHLAALAAQLRESGGPWLVGAEYTLADVSWSCVLQRLEETGWLAYFKSRQEFNEVEAYWQRLQERPSWRSAITDKAHPIIEQASRDLKLLLAQDAAVRQALWGIGAG
ncbi:MAG: glutathione S-transferase family protein [Burkholderiales bacterium]